MGNDISRATEGITNATMMSKTTMVPKVTVAIMPSEVNVATMCPTMPLVHILTEKCDRQTWRGPYSVFPHKSMKNT
jgi:hypothetical protein